MARNRIGTLSRWLVHEASQLPDVGAIIRRLAERLTETGVAVDRASVHFRILHPLYLGVSRIWTPADGLSLERPAHGDTAHDYRSSPLQYVRETNDSLEVRLDRDRHLEFPVFRGLRRAGLVHYLMTPLRFSDGTIEGASWATRRSSGFTDEELALLRALAGPLALVVELKRLRIMSAEVLAKYVGRDPAERILSGTVERGDLVHIRAALMFCDLVGYTAMTQRENAAAVVDRLNRYFEAVEDAIHAHGGEILKFIGDGVFAIFSGDGAAPVERAFGAARSCLEKSPDPLRIALHQGEIAYGNVGAPERLDFTAIGPDVNLLARLLEIGRAETRPLVFSKEIARVIPAAHVRLGMFHSRGFEQPVEVFAVELPGSDAGS